MKNIVINLERRPDRKKNIEKLFSEIEYNFYPAIDGKKLKGTSEIYNLFKGNDFKWRRGVIGCALSHYNIWNSLSKDEKFESYCIFEDDITLSNNFSQEILNKCKDFVISNDIDVLFLGYHMFKHIRHNLNHIYNSDNESTFHTYKKNLYIGGFFGYIISKKGANKMLKYIENNGIKHGIDYLIKINNDLNVYECQPFLVKSDWVDNPNSGIDSDIQKDFEYLKFDDEKFNEIVEISGTKYKFYRGLDSPGDDYKRIRTTDIHQIEQIARNEEHCLCFNSLGYLKNKISKLEKSPWFHPLNDGLYVKIPKEKEKNIKVKMLCNWCTSSQLCQEWNHMSKGNFKWNNIEITHEDNADYFVIINKPLHESDFYIPNKTIIFHMEPWCYSDEQKWGVKTWGKWSKPEGFLQVRSHDKYINNVLWQLKINYTELKNELIKKEKNNIISTICSSKYFDPGHIKRIDFLKYVEKKNDPSVIIDIYNWDNNHQFKNYKGSHPKGYKDIGIKPYKYYFMAENNSEKNFITEKIWEPLLTETLCFYWGCPNISDYIHPDAYVQLDLNNFEKSFQIIKNALENNLWEKRLNIIRAEKQKVLEYYNFFPTLERIIKETPIDYFSFIKKDAKKVCFIHSCNFGNIDILENLILKIEKSGLVNNLDYIIINNLGIPIDKKFNNKTNIINYSKNTNLFEIPTIKLISEFSKKYQNVDLLYLHTKGVSYKQNQNVDDWTNYMSYFMIYKYLDCMDKLKEYNTVGCNYLESPKPHFSGNFWWSNTKYIKNIDTNNLNQKHDAEWWILSDTKRFYSIHNSGINHYLNSYPVEKYIKK